MSNTPEIMENYYICLAEASDTSSPTSDTGIKNIKIKKVESKSISNIENELSLSESLTDNNHFENITSSSSIGSSTEKNILSSDGGNDISFAIIMDKLEILQNSLINEKVKNIMLNNQLKKLETKINNNFRNIDHDIDDLYDGLNNVDFKLIQLDQYTRRESLVISGIPESITQNNLEPTVLNIIRNIGIMNVSSYEVTACHRLYNKNNRYPPRTIIRFTNRKIVELCLSNRDRLKTNRHNINMNLRFYEHLTDSNEAVLKECIKLAQFEIINSYFIRNGFIKIVVNNGDKPLKIHHTAELRDIFKNYYDYHDLDYMP